MNATQIFGFVGTFAERNEHLKVKSDLSLSANVPAVSVAQKLRY